MEIGGKSCVCVQNHVEQNAKNMATKDLLTISLIVITFHFNSSVIYEVLWR